MMSEGWGGVVLARSGLGVGVRVRCGGCDGGVVKLRSVASDYQLMLMIKF